jgi:hypothetical protein
MILKIPINNIVNMQNNTKAALEILKECIHKLSKRYK